MFLVVSAISSETDALISQLDCVKDRSNDRLWRSPEGKVLISAVGVGYLAAALGLQALLLQIDQQQLEGVIFCGTAGVYSEQANLSIGDICSSNETLLTDAAAEMGISHFAPPLFRGPIRSSLELGMNINSAFVVTLLTLTLSEKVSKKIASKYQGAVENMELFGIATLCKNLQIPWNALLGITNVVGAEGSKQWKKNHLKVEQNVCKCLVNYFC